MNTITVDKSRALTFALSPDPGRTDTLGVKGVAPAQLRGKSGSLDQLLTGSSLAGLAGNTSQAIRVVDEALDRLTVVEGQVDGFANATVAAPLSLFSDLADDTEAALASFNAVDETAESILLARNQSLVENAIASISILQQQRESVLLVLQQAAGLH